MVKRGCDVHEHHREREDARSCDPGGAVTLNGSLYKDRGGSYGSQKPEAVADAVRDFLPEGLPAVL